MGLDLKVSQQNSLLMTLKLILMHLAVIKMLKEHENGSPKKAYVRAVEKHEILREGTFSLVICMFKAMSELLSQAK